MCHTTTRERRCKRCHTKLAPSDQDFDWCAEARRQESYGSCWRGAESHVSCLETSYCRPCEEERDKEGDESEDEEEDEKEEHVPVTHGKEDETDDDVGASRLGEEEEFRHGLGHVYW